MGRLTRPLLTILLLAALPAAGVAAAAPRSQGSAAAPDSFVYYKVPAEGDGPIERVASPVRRRVQPASAIPRSPSPLNAFADPDTEYDLFEHGFDVAADGSCDTRGWTGQERSRLVFAHVDDKHLTNDGYVTMGSKALWFGTDLATDPAEVSGWYYPEGFGCNWSQRLTSPSFTNGNYRLSFDGQVGMGATTGLLLGANNRFLAVQALKADGTWGMLSSRWVSSTGLALTTGTGTGAGLRGSGTSAFKCFVATSPDSQAGFQFATPTRIRVVFQSPNANSSEDGSTPPQPCPGAIVDNIVLHDLDSVTDPIPLQDFEGGTTGVWSLSAQNGGLTASNVIRDFPPPTTDVSIKKGFDPIDQSCLWQFTGAGGHIDDGAFARLTSPWIAWDAGADTAFQYIYRGSLPYDFTIGGRLMFFRCRGKNAGDAYARRFHGRPAFLVYGAGSSDLDTPVGTVSDIGAYPDSWSASGSIVCDSIQFVIELNDYCERFAIDPASRPPTRHPIIDDFRLVQYHMDADFDGVRDSKDLCPGVCAAGQDADGDGCPDATETLRHVESWPVSASPIHFRLSQHGDPDINDGSDLQALRNAFAAWTAVTGANVQVVEDPVTAQTNASATDGINLLTFEDDYAFPGNVLAITPTLSFTKRTAFDDRLRLPGEIVDADILFNPAATFRTATAGPASGSFDLQSVATHEIGHFLGLSHSGVADATMFPVLQAGTLAASLESDDKAAIAAAYPGATLLTAFGRISGRVTRGSNGAPIPGALVMGVLLDGGGAPQDTVASDYTDEDGYYHLYRLPAGDYAVRVVPLDGSIPGVVPGAINARVLATAETNFQAEWYGGPESNHDDPDVRQAIAISPGSNASGIDIITNIDVTPPTVVSASPADQAGGVRIDTPILVTFSEPVDANTIGSAFKLHLFPGSGTLGGHGELLTPGVSFVFVPDQPLSFATDYQLQLTTALQDVQGNPIAATYGSVFTTEPRPPVSISDLSPRQAPVGALVTITGAGYDAGVENRVYFSTSQGFAGYVLGTLVTPTSLVVEVPSDAVSGPVKVEVAGVATPSNVFTFALLTSTVAAPSPNGSAVATGFPPADVALSPDAKTAFAVGALGFVRINLDPLRPFLRQAQPAQPALVSCAHLALNPSGLRAYVSRPDLGELVEMDTDPGSGTFGQARATIPLPGRPDGVAVSSSGQRAYVTDAASGVVYEIDVDAGSATYRHALREIPVPGAAFTGGIAVDARRDRLVLATRNLGVVTVDLDTTSIITTVSADPAAGAVAVAPGGNQVLATSPDPSAGRVVFGSPVVAQAASAVDIGGDARDVVIHPDGATAFVANAVLSRLQVLDVTQPTPVLVANVATGGTPVAVAVSANGTLIATADFAGQSVSFYNVVGTATPVRVTPPVAVPGDRVAVAATGGALSGGTLADVGTGDLPAVHAVASAMAFAVPPGEQRATAVTLINGGVRSLATPFQVVDPIDVFDPRATGVVLDPQNASCGVGSVDGALGRVVVSPDGTRLAVTRQGPACALVDVYQVIPDLTHVLGARLVNGVGIPGATALYDLAFTPDSKKVWVASDAGGLFEVDVDLATVLAFGGATVGTAHALATDPMGRYVVVGAHVSAGVDQVQLWSPGRTLANAVSVLGEVHALAMSPDGHYAIAGAEGRAHIVNVSNATLTTSTPVHVFAPPDRLTSIAVTTDGRRAAGVFPGNALAIWNLDPLAGTVGAELFYDASSLPGTISQLVPAPDGDAMLAGCADCNTLFKFEPAAPPPAGHGPLPGGAALPMGQRSRALARSVDGRQLWVADWTDGTLLGDVKAFTLTRGTTLALVSGSGQSASPSQTLPLPVRVHLISDADGHDASGALVRFSLAGSTQGTLDGGALAVVKPTGITGEAEVTWTMPGAATPVSLTVEALGVSGASLAVDAEAVADPAVAIPAVVGLGPANGTTGVDAGTSVFVRFSQPMVRGAIDSAAVLVVNGAAAGRTTRYDDQDRSMFLTPTIPLAYSARCSLYLPAGLRDQAGQLLPAPVTTVFTVQGPPVLAIHSISPPSAPVGCPITINGEGFSSIASVNGVSLNGLLSPVTSASTGSLITTVSSTATSGPLTVTVGAVTSAPVPFVVLPANPVPLQVGVEEDVRSGIEAIALTPDGSRAYITLPGANCVLAYDLVQRRVIKSIAVGLRPQAIAITPDGHYAYVANTGSDNLSVIDIDPASPGYHKTLSGPAYPIKVGDQPRSIAISAFGPTLLVANGGDGTLSVIDAEPTRGTFDRVTKTIAAGTGGTAIVLTADGTRAYVATDAGILVVDVESQAVTATIKVGSGAKNVAITADGTVLFALDHDGFLNIIDIAPGSTTYNQVTKSINVGAGAASVAISADGTLLYLTMQDTNVALGFQIFKGATGGPGGSTAPGLPTTLALVDTVAVGESPGAIAMFPNSLGGIVVNQASGTVSFLGGAITIGVEPKPAPVVALALLIHPTPSYGSVTLRFAVPKSTPVDVDIFDIQGRLVRQVVHETVAPGWHAVDWDGGDRAGGLAGAGVYLVRMRAGGRELHRRIVRLR